MAEERLKNPFVIVGNIPQEYFCDRRAESARIVRTLTNQSNLLLMSARRMGKSGLIKYCFNLPEIRDNYYTFYIDILHTSSFREFVATFGQQVFDALKSRGEKTLKTLAMALRSLAGSFGYDPLSGNPTFQLEIGKIQRPEYTLQEIFDWLEHADKPCIVALDEFQQIDYYPEKNIEALLRGYIQHLGNVNFIYAGSERHLLSEMFLSSARPFYNSTSLLYLDPIAEKEYVPFVCQRFRAYGKSIEEDTVKWAYDYLYANTFCMQKLFHEAFINTVVGGVCDLPLLQQTLEDILTEEGASYSKLLSRIPERQKELLYAIAKEHRAKRILGAKFIKDNSLASASAVQAAVRKLLEDGFVSMEQGEYYVEDVFFKLFLIRLIGIKLVL